MNDFELFKKYFKKYQIKFGLIGYKVYFKHEPLEGAYANITINLADMIATVRLDSKPTKEDKLHINIKRLAKHEVMHLLIGRLSQNGKTRYMGEDEMYETIEELAMKLENLIDD